jgi:hypothetical protein
MNPSNRVVRELVAAINHGDRAGFLAAMAPDATLTDDGTQRPLREWIDKEIFTVNGRMTVERQDPDGLSIVAWYRNDTWGEMKTSWRFTLAKDKITRIDTEQAV